MLQTVSFMVAVFVCTWYLCILSIFIALKLDLQDNYMYYVMTFTVCFPHRVHFRCICQKSNLHIIFQTILAYIAYSQNFYVLWLHNPRYRRTFSEQMKWLNPWRHIRQSGRITADDSKNSPQTTCGDDRINNSK
ncbi:hypothetical protein Y032_0520g2853 [Ancylostoma ceylanicum]|uniref:Uncharacterized protein n=1 Tax=Ancylostoma ceylanicum TaxID=53326 RepID=A0A016WT03_9BILA|nr:hypothetical protein Y032_0520g2853 [Ancylostoma ceylanicum]